MIVSSFSPKHGNCSLIIESADDLWTLRRLIHKGDVLVTRSSRISKREDEYSRPDKGERVKVTIALEVGEVHLDNSIERLRVKGTIRESSDESVTKAGSHSVSLSPGHSLTIRKERWSPLEVKLVNSTKDASGRFVMVAIDRREAGVGVLSGSHLSVLTTFESGLGGKMSGESDPKPFLSKIAEIVNQQRKAGDTVVVAGPGHTKNTLINLLAGGKSASNVKMVEGFDLTGSDGVRAMVRFPPFQEVARGSVVIEIERLVNESVKRISGGDGKVAYTLARVEQAARAGAVESCAASDDVFSGQVDEEELVDTLNAIESQRGKVYLADSSMDYGKQISSFGGIVALLRYSFKSY